MTYKIYTFQAYIQPRLSYIWTFQLGHVGCLRVFLWIFFVYWTLSQVMSISFRQDTYDVSVFWKYFLGDVRKSYSFENLDSNDSLTSSLPLAIDTILRKGHKRYCFCLYLLSPSNFPIYTWFLCPTFYKKCRTYQEILDHLVLCEIFLDFPAN